jgi:hypothetical protein
MLTISALPLRIALAAAALAVVVAGCGNDRLSEQVFFVKVDAICADADQVVSRLDPGDVDPTSDEATDSELRKYASFLDGAFAAFGDEARKLEKLDPPPVFRQQFHESMASLTSSLTRLDSAAKAARKGDKEALLSAFADFELYGENACGGVSGLFSVQPGDEPSVLLAGKERSVDWSPDGHWITSTAGPERLEDIVSPRTGGRHRAVAVKWSRDGSMLAYSTGDKLFAGRSWGEARLVGRGRGSDVLDWAPGSKEFVVGLARTSSCCWPSLGVARADGTGLRKLWTPPADGPAASWINFAAWSPTGREILVEATVNNGVASRKGGEFFYLVDPDGRSASKLSYAGDASFEGWSPDGRWLIFHSDTSVYRLSPHGGEAESVCRQSCPGAVFAADGRRFAFVTRSGRSRARYTLWVEDVAGGNKRRIADLPRSRELGWSADGSRIALLLAGAGRKAGVAVVDVATRKLRRLTDGSHFDSAPLLSSDGSFAAFTRQSSEHGQPDLWVVGTGGGDARRVATIGDCGGYAWSPTERVLAFTNGPCLPS